MPEVTETRKKINPIADTQKKRRLELLQAFSTVSSELNRRIESGLLSPQDGRECHHGRDVIACMNTKFRSNPLVHDADIVDLLFPRHWKEHEKQVQTMSENGIWKLSHFLRHQRLLIQKSFSQKELKLPVVLELLHIHFNHEQVILPTRPACFVPHWLQNIANVELAADGTVLHKPAE